MPVRIVTILGRLKQDLADGLSREAIEQACRAGEILVAPADARSGHDRLSVYPPDPSRQHRLFARGPLRPMELHRCRLLCRAEAAPLAVLRRLAARIAASVRTATTAQSTWHGHRVWLLDGSSFSMPDTRELQEAFGQPSGQRRGCGFPVAKFLALFDLATGMLLRVEPAPLRSHEHRRECPWPPPL